MNWLFIVTHKPANIPQKPGFLPVLVGKKDFSLPGAMRDDAGDNIAEKNPYYCELTAQYAAWKNPPAAAEYVGLAHYRRYFTTRRFSRDPAWFLDGENLPDVMAGADVILMEPWYFPCTVWENYFTHGCGREKDLQLTEAIIDELYPAYGETFRRVVRRNHASYCNMFVMSWARFDAYCQWLFSILFTLEERVDLTGYTPAQARIFGYLSEILLNVWVEHNSLKVRYLPIAETETGKHYRVWRLRKACRQWMRRMQFRLRRR